MTRSMVVFHWDIKARTDLDGSAVDVHVVLLLQTQQGVALFEGAVAAVLCTSYSAVFVGCRRLRRRRRRICLSRSSLSPNLPDVTRISECRYVCASVCRTSSRRVIAVFNV